MIDKNKQYTTRNGLPVRIYATDGEDPWSVHGAILFAEGWKPRVWTKDGKADIHGYKRIYDLIEVKPRIQMTAWVNVYDSSVIFGYETLELAKKYRSDGCIACIQIAIDYEEGEGL